MSAKLYYTKRDFITIPASSSQQKKMYDFIKKNKKEKYPMTLLYEKTGETLLMDIEYIAKLRKFINTDNGYTASKITVIDRGHLNKLENGKNEPRVLLQNKNKGLLGFDLNNVEELLSIIVKCSFNENLIYLNKLINILKSNKKIIDHKDLYEKVYGYSPMTISPDEKFYELLANNKKELFCFLRKCCELFPDETKGFLLAIKVKYKK